MQLPASLATFNPGAVMRLRKLLPIVSTPQQIPQACCNCHFVNHREYLFCTNCGYPLHHNDDNLKRYHSWVQNHREVLRRCRVKIERARNALYVVAASGMIGIFYVFSPVRPTVISGFIMLVLGVIFAGLARWSVFKPFTALLISFIVMLTFTVINTWGEVSSRGKSASAIYLFVIQVILIYFLWQGVKGAFRADILEEEFKVK